jgi:hypothetical protein
MEKEFGTYVGNEFMLDAAVEGARGGLMSVKTDGNHSAVSEGKCSEVLRGMPIFAACFEKSEVNFHIVQSGLIVFYDIIVLEGDYQMNYCLSSGGEWHSWANGTHR